MWAGIVTKFSPGSNGEIQMSGLLSGMRVPATVAAFVLVSAFAAFWLRAAVDKSGEDAGASKAESEGATPRYFEMRTYHTAADKMEALHTRFRDHTNRLFQKHGIELVGYWNPADEAEKDKKLIFILAYPDKASRDKSWEAFANDPDWVKAKAESEKDGVLVEKVEEVFMSPTDYSPVQ